MTTVNYEADIVAWANEQAWLVRNKKFELLDIEHIAYEHFSCYSHLQSL